MENTTKLPTGITTLPDGRYLVRVQKIDPRRPGVLVWKKKKLPASAKLADAVLARSELATEIATGGRPTQLETTLSVYAQSWLRRKLARLQSDTTRERYTLALQNHILPEFADWRVSAIDKVSLEDWLVMPRNKYGLNVARAKREGWENYNMTREVVGYSPESVNGWWRVFKSMLQDAVEDLGLQKDPTLKVKPLPSEVDTDEDEEDANTFSADEVIKMLAAAWRLYPQWYAFMVLGFTIGCRPGELRPLRWDTDLDLDSGKLTLRRSQHNKYVGPTKTKKKRSMLLPPEVVEVMRWHRDWLQAVDHPGKDSGLVFPSAGPGEHDWTNVSATRVFTVKKSGNPFLGSSAFVKPFQAMCKAAGVTGHFTPKSFRRTFNDIARKEAGLNNLLTRSLTGHQSIEMQETYSTVDLEEKRAGLAKVIQLYKLVPPMAPAVVARAKSRAKLTGNKRAQG